MAYLGMCGLGVFVGAILALGLEYFKDKSSYLQLSVAIIAAALSGTVVGFLDYLARQGPNPGLFAYPIGLVMAVVWYYVRVADGNINDPSRTRQMLGWFHLGGLVLASFLILGLVLPPAISDVYTYITNPIRHYYVNGYHFEFDGTVKRLKAEADNIDITREPAAIRVTKGSLWVGSQDYGKVQPRDHISVLGGKILVNETQKQPPDKQAPPANEE